MSASDILVRIRLLLADRVSRPPTRGDNQKLSVALWDLHNVMPNNTNLFNIWHALSSSKKDLARFEQGVMRLTNFLQSSAVTGIAPALGTAAAFYNQSVKNDATGGDTVIRSGVPFVTPPPPSLVTPSASTQNRRPSAISVERITPAPSYGNRAFPNASNASNGRLTQPAQSEFTVVAAAETDLDSYPDDAPPGYTYVAEAVQAPSPSPPPPAPTLPEKGALHPSWQEPLSKDGAGSSHPRSSASRAVGSSSLSHVQSSESPTYAPSVSSSARGVTQSPPQPSIRTASHTPMPPVPSYTPYGTAPTPTNASSSQVYNPLPARTTGESASSTFNTSESLNWQAPPPSQQSNSSSLQQNSESSTSPVLRSNVTGASVATYPAGAQPSASANNQSWRPTHASMPSIPAYSPLDPASLSSPPPTATSDANMQPSSPATRAPALTGSAAIYQQQPTLRAISSRRPATAYSSASLPPAPPPPLLSNQRGFQSNRTPPPPQNLSTVAQYPTPATSPAAVTNSVVSPPAPPLLPTASSPTPPTAGTRGLNAEYYSSWSTTARAGQQSQTSNQHPSATGQQQPHQAPQYHPGNIGASQATNAEQSRPPMVHSGTPPPQEPTPASDTSYPSPPPSASYGQTSQAAPQPGTSATYYQPSGQPPAHRASTVPVSLQSAWGNQAAQTSPARTATSASTSGQIGGSFPSAPGIVNQQQSQQPPAAYSMPPQGVTPNYSGQPVAAQSLQTVAYNHPPTHHADTAPLQSQPSAAYASQSAFGQGIQNMQQHTQPNAQEPYRPPQFHSGNVASGQSQSFPSQQYTATATNNPTGQSNGYVPTTYNPQAGPTQQSSSASGNMLGTVSNLAGQTFSRLAAGNQNQTNPAVQAYPGRPPQSGHPAAHGRPPNTGAGGGGLAALGKFAYHVYNQHHRPQNNNAGGGGGGGFSSGGGGGGGYDGGDGTDQVNNYYFNSDPTSSGDPGNTFDMSQLTINLDNDPSGGGGGFMDALSGAFNQTPDGGGDSGFNFTDTLSGVGDFVSNTDTSTWFTDN